ncbi:hypothetical protein VNO77_26665 [Canavalia gladiata]|uniref:Uncharacterized protein n=1 Tax=Canavalia gladiata TaxID=3824 RepID=A0AAN9KUH5_CANGL
MESQAKHSTPWAILFCNLLFHLVHRYTQRILSFPSLTHSTGGSRVFQRKADFSTGNAILITRFDVLASVELSSLSCGALVLTAHAPTENGYNGNRLSCICIDADSGYGSTDQLHLRGDTYMNMGTPTFQFVHVKVLFQWQSPFTMVADFDVTVIECQKDLAFELQTDRLNNLYSSKGEPKLEVHLLPFARCLSSLPYHWIERGLPLSLYP